MSETQVATQWTPAIGQRVKDTYTSGRLGTIVSIRRDDYIVVDVDDAGSWTFLKSELKPFEVNTLSKDE